MAELRKINITTVKKIYIYILSKKRNATCENISFTSNFQHHFKYRYKHYITLKLGTLVAQTLQFIKMANYIRLKSIAFRWRHFSQYMLYLPLACAQYGHISSPLLLHPGTSPEKPDGDSKRNIIKYPRSPTNTGTDSQKPSPWKRLCTHQTFLLCLSTEKSTSTCKGPMVQQRKGLGPAKLEASLVQR